ncbi:MAG TPA: GatB/YqeY domain-containing protein [Alphaproteobacteria bacterium]|nr:GatB/YqeY domain-containing protein [Alphaproteobacteria bacterium]
MLRQELNDALKTAMKAKDERAVSTLRMVLAGLKDKDIAARTKGVTDGIPDDEARTVLQNMIRQRRDSIAMYEKGGRAELVKQESEEIAIIERFLPKQMGAAEIETAAKAVIAELGAKDIKDMGKVMGAMKQRYAGQMDLSQVGAIVKKSLGA